MNVVFVGAGRLATQFAQALRDKGNTIETVYSRTLPSAQQLTALVGGEATADLDALPLYADLYILAVKDSALPLLIPQLVRGREGRPMYHTSGSVPMSVFGQLRHHGVIYPLQTFSKERRVDFARVPFFIEANNALSLHVARLTAEQVSTDVREMSSDDRRRLHLAAVFACNFANHCYELGAEVLERAGIGFDALLPLIEETAAKVQTMHPRQAQTGPAVRFDEGIISRHLTMLADEPRLRAVYELMSKSIHETAKQ